MKRLLPSKNAGFTLVELLIVLVIVATLSVVAYLSVSRTQNRNMNAKVGNDLIAIENALEQYKNDNNGLYPVPEVGTTNMICFEKNTAYAHDCEDAFFLQTHVTQQLITKRYLPNLPTDPRTGAPYAYGVSSDGKSYQIAGVQWDKDAQQYKAEVNQYFDESLPLNSLIRSYNSPEFVVDGGVYLPHHPSRFQVSAQLYEPGQGVVVTNASGQSVDLDQMLRENYTIQVPKGEEVTLYFSDGSVSVLGSASEPSELTLLSPSDQELEEAGPVSRVFLKLSEGRVFNKVVRMGESSQFNVQTTTAIAGVRGTEFVVEVGVGQDDSDRLHVYNGEVAVRKKNAQEMEQPFVEVGRDALDEADWVVTSENAWVSVDIVNEGFDNLANQVVQSHAPANVQPDDQDLLTKQYLSQVSLSNSVYPVLLSVDAPNETFSVQALDELNQGLAAELSVSDLYACNQEIAAVCEQEGPDVCDIDQKCLQFNLPGAQNNVYEINANLQAFQDLNQQNPNVFAFGIGGELSAFSTPGVFLDDATELSVEELDAYEEEVVYVEQQEPDLQQEDPQLQCEANGGYWWDDGSGSGPACWVLGAKDESCTDACTAFGQDSGIEGGLACDTLYDWNDTDECDVCKGLVGEDNGVDCTDSGKDYSPFFYDNGNFMVCRNFDNSGDQIICDEAASDLGRNRICKCLT